ncbi:hypothetical protein GCM10018980_14310 [Streptomyces capoamus]|uniref:Uncharacterized protein n=1 Tax=Streptomyces capoamus TaxID=68183 RepID=A0A919EUB4_9ACTN|nr:hypothetical protein [Streptomyces capoamus]GGW14022.1 hypothetical protein GCM10010501_20190 [Streptomyces libani subsp. rufus]GHG40235.1 hypothetical protein GCM10018980_14310 [Streptomyces capoamus]
MAALDAADQRGKTTWNVMRGWPRTECPRRTGRPDGFGPHKVVLGVRADDGGPVGGGTGGGQIAVEVEGDADLARPGRAEGPDREPVPVQQTVGGGERAPALLGAGGVAADGVPEEGAAPRLVQGDPARHPVGQARGDGRRVLRDRSAVPLTRPSDRAWRPARCPP